MSVGGIPGRLRDLERPEGHPLWWPEGREVRRLGPDHSRLRFVLTVDLRVTARAVRRARGARALEVALGGDLDGWLRWTLAAGGGSRAALARVGYRQDTERATRSCAGFRAPRCRCSWSTTRW